MAFEVGKSLGVLLIGAWLVFGVIRPLLRQLAAPTVELERLGRSPVDVNPDNGPDTTVELSGQNPNVDRLQAAKQLAKQDPKLVATVVKQWVNQ